MKKLLVLMLLNACLLANVWAKDDAGAKGIGDSLKKAGDAAGSLMGQGGKAAAPEVRKAESWLDGALHGGGNKTDKAGK
ncbi:MAG TPA: hypothetical protein VMV48_10465 [Gallionellaceae bacterium]|nr:hypothetical protein [Gallionellaceae bacterium]